MALRHFVLAGAALAAVASAPLAARNPMVGGAAIFANKRGACAVMDSKGGMATVTIANVMQSSGVIHVIDRLLMS